MTGWIIIALLAGGFYVAQTNEDLEPTATNHIEEMNEVPAD